MSYGLLSSALWWTNIQVVLGFSVDRCCCSWYFSSAMQKTYGLMSGNGNVCSSLGGYYLTRLQDYCVQLPPWSWSRRSSLFGTAVTAESFVSVLQRTIPYFVECLALAYALRWMGLIVPVYRAPSVSHPQRSGMSKFTSPPDEIPLIPLSGNNTPCPAVRIAPSALTVRPQIPPSSFPSRS